MIVVRNLETGIVLRGFAEQVPDLMRATGAGICSVHQEAVDAPIGVSSLGVGGFPVTGTVPFRGVPLSVSVTDMHEERKR